ncbi:MAG: hypothetical protein A2309_06935 [Bacteroidetes bacterium RIFOXYB2_FULL_35_7]|nr:MAG: hypothetical protein A2X01_00980 [Bacteroidetes bacterium GWF2_35_48]OFY92910.1 MAG: hypothetical protein A2491_13430 [Bacteroidetes bacterium RIFOXYC12_FULL_35_7]OFY96011.1 MAG: hypothetical protein A2309_06935 [Bacteroidetes bacterium RIFOXYB2_FULL_35_7]
MFPDTSDNDLAKENQLENLQPEQQKYEEQISNGQVLSIFPNPTQGLLHVQLSSTNGITSQPATLEILDINGKKHYSNQSFLGNESINMVTFPSGIYFLKLDIGGQKTEWKIVRQ